MTTNDWPSEVGDGRVLVVQLREEADAPPPLYRVQGVGAADSGAVEKDWGGLQLGTSQGAVDEIGVERGGDGSSD